MRRFLRVSTFIIICSLLSLVNTHANDLIFVGEENKNWFNETEKTQIKHSIETVQEKYGLNMDIVILGANDQQSCYNQPSIDQCVQKKYYLASDLIVVIKMKSDQSNSGDIRSLIGDDLKSIIPISDLKSIQDSITLYFKNADFSGGLIQYNKNLTEKIQGICEELNSGENCNIFDLNNNYLEKRNRIANSIAERNHNIEIEQSNQKHKISLVQRKETGQSILLYLFGSIVILLCSVLLIRYFIHLFYIGKIKSILKDIIYRENIIDDKKLYLNSKNKFKNLYKNLRENIETYLADTAKTLSKSKQILKKYQQDLLMLDTQVSEEVKNYTTQSELADEIDKLTDINL